MMERICIAVAGVDFHLTVNHGRCSGGLAAAVRERLAAAIDEIDWSDIKPEALPAAVAARLDARRSTYRTRAAVCAACGTTDRCPVWAMKKIKVGCCGDRFTVFLSDRETNCPEGRWPDPS